MRESGVIVRPNGSDIYVKGPNELKAVNVKTLAHPGFPTDMQPQIMSMLTIANGTSTIVENLFEERMKAAPELCKMGADITINGNIATVHGVKNFTVHRLWPKTFGRGCFGNRGIGRRRRNGN